MTKSYTEIKLFIACLIPFIILPLPFIIVFSIEQNKLAQIKNESCLVNDCQTFKNNLYCNYTYNDLSALIKQCEYTDICYEKYNNTTQNCYIYNNKIKKDKPKMNIAILTLLIISCVICLLIYAFTLYMFIIAMGAAISISK